MSTVDKLRRVSVAASGAIFEPPAVSEADFVVIECGAREASIGREIEAAFRHARLIGFEPDVAECERLNNEHDSRYTFYPLAVGGRREKRPLHILRNPACSSLLEPNSAFLQSFAENDVSFVEESRAEVATVDLDTYLPSVGVASVDVLRLDVQGAELEVMQGASSLISSSVLAVHVEAELNPMYREQPLLGDIDAFLRPRGFQLFDLSRVRYRRKGLPPEVETRCQLLWGDALYFRDGVSLQARGLWIAALKLAVLTSAYGFHDYSAEIVQAMLDNGAGLPDGMLREQVERAYSGYLSSLCHVSPATRMLGLLARARAIPGARRLARPLRHALATRAHSGATHWGD